MVRRAAFLHEIGTVDDTSHEVDPVLRSADLAAKCNESEPVVRALRGLVRSGGCLECRDKVIDGTLVFRVGSARVNDMTLDPQLGAALLQANAKADAMDRVRTEPLSGRLIAVG